MEMTHNNNWQWSNFTWLNASLPALTVVAWRIWYNDTSNNYNVTNTMSFTIADTQSANYTLYGQNVSAINTINESILMYSNWTDNIALSYYTFSCNLSTA